MCTIPRIHRTYKSFINLLCSIICWKYVVYHDWLARPQASMGLPVSLVPVGCHSDVLWFLEARAMELYETRKSPWMRHAIPYTDWREYYCVHQMYSQISLSNLLFLSLIFTFSALTALLFISLVSQYNVSDIFRFIINLVTLLNFVSS